MRILFDTNVVLDVLLDRIPFVAASASIWNIAERKQSEGLLAAHAVTTIFYIVQKQQGNAAAKRTVASLLQVFGVAAIDDSAIRDALLSPIPDFEDSVTASAASRAKCDFIVTRDPKGFQTSQVPAFAPEALIALIRSFH
jgi:predicted nucleic acid-binding protein